MRLKPDWQRITIKQSTECMGLWRLGIAVAALTGRRGLLLRLCALRRLHTEPEARRMAGAKEGEANLMTQAYSSN